MYVFSVDTNSLLFHYLHVIELLSNKKIGLERSLHEVRTLWCDDNGEDCSRQRQVHVCWHKVYELSDRLGEVKAQATARPETVLGISQNNRGS